MCVMMAYFPHSSIPTSPLVSTKWKVTELWQLLNTENFWLLLSQLLCIKSLVYWITTIQRLCIPHSVGGAYHLFLVLVSCLSYMGSSNSLQRPLRHRDPLVEGFKQIYE